LQTLEDLFDLR